MMNRWGLDGMRSFEQAGVAMKEAQRGAGAVDVTSETAPAPAPTRTAPSLD
jgi:hypothetical protein